MSKFSISRRSSNPTPQNPAVLLLMRATALGQMLKTVSSPSRAATRNVSCANPKFTRNVEV